MGESKDLAGDGQSIRSRNPHDSQTAAALGRGDSDDGVVRVQATAKCKSGTAAALHARASGPASLWAPGALKSGRRRFRQARHAGRIDHHLAEPAMPGALTAYRALVAQRQVDDTPLPAVHGIEFERNARAFHFFSGRNRTQP